MEKRTEGRFSSSFALRLAKSNFCFLNSPTSTFSENIFIRFLSISFPAHFCIFPLSFQLLNLMVTPSSSGGICGCGGMYQTPKQLISADLPATSFTIVRVHFGSITLHLLPFKVPFSLCKENGYTTCQMPSRTPKVHYTSIHLKFTTLTARTSKSSHQDLTIDNCSGKPHNTLMVMEVGQ